MGIVHPNFFRLIGQADLHAVVAAGSEGAARGQVGQVHRGTGDGDQLVVSAVQGGNGTKQALGVLVTGIVENLIHRAPLADPAGVHDNDLVAHIGDHAQVVGNHDDGHAHFLLQVLHQLQNLGLNGHVQSGGGFIGNQDVRLTGQRHGDHHPLAHAAGKLVGILLQPLFRLVHAHQLEHFQRPGVGLGPVAVGVEQDGFPQLIADGKGGVQRGHGILKDDADPLAAKLPHLLLGILDDVLAVEENLATNDFAGLHQNAHDGVGGHALAGAAFAHDAQHLALI